MHREPVKTDAAETFIVFVTNGQRNSRGQISLLTNLPDAERFLETLLMEGVPAERIGVFRATPADRPVAITTPPVARRSSLMPIRRLAKGMAPPDFP